MEIFIFFTIHWYSSFFFQSIFQHRYAAHSMFTMSAGWEKAFYIGSFLTQGSSYVSPYAYGILHRLHHAFTDTEEDPHSPKHSANFLTMIRQTRKNYNDIYFGKMTVDEKYKKGLPKWDSFENLAHNWVSRLLWFVVYITIYIYFATAWWMYLLLPMHFGMVIIQGAMVNWWAHKFGYSNFNVNNDSKNIIPVDIILWGESYHNNHHKYPSRPNIAVKWFEFDPGFTVIKVLDKLKIIRLKRESA